MDDLELKAAENLDRWAEITTLAIELRKAVLAREVGEEEAESRVWAEIRERKEKEWAEMLSKSQAEGIGSDFPPAHS